MFSCIDKKILNENNDILNIFCTKYPNTKSINMLNDTRFFNDDFSDSDHLSFKGASKFSILLNEEINTLYLD